MSAEEREVRRRMAAHELYADFGPGLAGLDEERMSGKELADRYNATSARDSEGRGVLLSRLLGSVGENVWIEPPLRVSYGNHVHIGSDFYANFNLTLVDDVDVRIGDRVMIAPNVVITTTGHPLHPELRRTWAQFSAEVTIGDDVWIGASAVILPGITIGTGSIVGAASVVTGNVPPDVVVAGNPARVIRAITDADREFRYRPPRDLG